MPICADRCHQNPVTRLMGPRHSGPVFCHDDFSDQGIESTLKVCSQIAESPLRRFSNTADK